MTTTTAAGPEPIGVPAIMTGQALYSLRESGYSLSAALGEVLDNSIEADSNNIRIRLEEGTNSRGKKHVHRIAVSDDGYGMPHDVLQCYPQIGFSTRYMRNDTIGKFGVGAKLAALNYSKRFDVWSRADSGGDWLHVHLDLNEAIEAETSGRPVTISPPSVVDVPNELTDMLPGGTGTLVVWSDVDRLEHGMRAADFNALRLEVEKELSRIFRVFISNGITFEINGRQLLPHDPLMLMADTWAIHTLREYYSNGEGADAPWKPEPLEFSAEIIKKSDIKIGNHLAALTVTLYPASIARKRGMAGDRLAKDLRLLDNLGAISFMRLDREISYTNVPRIFPRGVQDPDRFIGVQVDFDPELDDYFGVRNVKRGAEPHDQLRDKIRSLLSGAITEARKKLDDYWGQAARAYRQKRGEHSAVTDAAASVNRTMPKSRAVDTNPPESAYNDLANDVLGQDSSTQERQEYFGQVKSLPFIVESVDFPGRQFIDIQHVDGKVVVRVNTRHRFYRETWAPLREIAESEPGARHSAESVQVARRTVEALTLLLIAYGKAESMQENPHEEYGELRDFWGIFLDTMMSSVRDVL